MSGKSESYFAGWNRATVAGFAWLVLTFGLLVPVAAAQINGVPPSVTSLGFGGHPGPLPGVAPGVTSLGPRGFTSRVNPAFVQPNIVHPNHHHRRNLDGLWGGIYAAPYALPYYGYDSGEYATDDSGDDQYNGGPTIFDRRGPGAVPRPPSAYSDREPVGQEQAAPVEQAEATPAPDQPQTVLVFKDGHQQEVENYAIVGSTLYDLSDGRRRKISLTDLDLTATAKQNDERGIDFRVPGSATQAN